jgi:hypothetical protein
LGYPLPSIVNENTFKNDLLEKLFSDESGYRKHNKLPFIEFNSNYESDLNKFCLKIEQRTYFSSLFNKKLKGYCEVNNFMFVDTFNFFIEEKIINSKYIDGKDHHIKMNDILCIDIYKNALSKCINLINN